MAVFRTVMVSSTARDLPKHREQVEHACLARHALPLMMEHLPATSADAKRVSAEMVDRCDVYVGVFGHRYGFVPSDGEISVTELEYLRAVERGIPRLIFLMADGHPLTAADVEKGAAATRLEALKQRLLTEQFDGYLRQYQRAFIAAVENLWQKYAVTTKQILAERDREATQLNAFLKELGYE